VTADDTAVDETGWTAYLDTLAVVADALEAALQAADGSAAEGADGWLPTVPEVAMPIPAGPPPTGSLDRREALLARLVVLTGALEQRRDDVADRLAGLPSRRPRTSERHAGALGGSLDLVG
jgi:hypothetical protein